MRSGKTFPRKGCEAFQNWGASHAQSWGCEAAPGEPVFGGRCSEALREARWGGERSSKHLAENVEGRGGAVEVFVCF